ncbi:MAG: DUF7948 domain-containing protein [Bacteroidia bacterium]
MRALFLICLFGFFLKTSAQSDYSKQTAPQESGYIQQNQGQIKDQYWNPRPDVLFSGECGELDFFIRNNGISYQISQFSHPGGTNGIRGEESEDSASLSVYRVDLNWIDFNPDQHYQTEDEKPGYANYYNVATGEDPALFVKSYSGLWIRDVWENIDLSYHFKNGHLESDWHLANPADVSKIRFEVTGAEVSVNEEGYLVLKTPFGEIREGALKVLQGNKILTANWVVQGSIVGFQLGTFEPGIPIIIDPPTRIWSTDFGGGNEEYGYAIDVDQTGAVYMAGNTNSTSSIATFGAHQTTFGGSGSGVYPGDAFIVKLNSQGGRTWATYFGGSDNEFGYSCRLDTSGNLYVVGKTASTTGISTSGSYMNAFGGSRDAFVVKFNSSGVRQWGTYLGGPLVEEANDCVLDKSGNLYVTGFTSSFGGIATSGAWQSTKSQNYDAFVTKFTSSGIRLWGTYIGGIGYDEAFDCDVDDSANLYIAGYTESDTVFGFQAPFNGSKSGAGDAFLSKFDSSGTMIWSNYFGGNGEDEAHGCAVDKFGDIYMAGFTMSTSNIATSNAHQTSNGGGRDLFLAKFTQSGNRVWSTYYGGLVDDWSFEGACATDHLGNVLLFGFTYSSNGIATNDAFQQSIGGDIDIAIVKFNPNGVRTWGSYFGGTSWDLAIDGVVDAFGNLHISGYTSSVSSIASAGAFQSALAGSSDAFVAKFQVTVPNVISSSQKVCEGTKPITLFGPGYTTGGYTYKWLRSVQDSLSGYQHAGSNDSASGYQADVLTANTWFRRVLIQNGVYDTSNAIFMELVASPIADFSLTTDSLCQGDSLLTLNLSSISSGSIQNSYWVIGDSTVDTSFHLSYSPDKIGTDTLYLIVRADYNCVDTLGKPFTIFPNPLTTITTSDTTKLCPGDSVRLMSIDDPSYEYSWFFNEQAISGSNDSFISLKDSGRYFLKVTSSFGCIRFSDTVGIEISTVPDVKWHWSNDTICEGSEVRFTDSTTTDPQLFKSRNWVLNAQSMGNTKIVNRIFTDTGSYAVKLVIVTPFGCRDSIMADLVVGNKPDLNAITGRDTGVYPDSMYSYSISGELGNNLTWTANNGTVVSGQGTSTVQVDWMDTTVASLSLESTNSNGCFDSAGITVLLNLTPVIFSFTPTEAFQFDTVRINGINLSKTTAVKFGDTNSISFIIISGTQIRAIVGGGATGDVLVESPYGTATRSGFIFKSLGGPAIHTTPVEIYPNPFHDVLIIKSGTDLTDQEYFIYNVQGTAIRSGVLNGQLTELDLSGLSPGLYLMGVDNVLYRIVKY